MAIMNHDVEKRQSVIRFKLNSETKILEEKVKKKKHFGSFVPVANYRAGIIHVENIKKQAESIYLVRARSRCSIKILAKKRAKNTSH